MTTRIALGGGKFCYAGPSCRLHSANGIEQARKLRDEATQAFTSARSLYEMTAAKAKLKEAQVAFDATADGQKALKEDLARVKDPLTAIELKSRLDDAVALEKKIESIHAKQSPNEDGLVSSIQLSSKSDAEAYEEENNFGIDKFVGSNGRGTENAWRGKKFENGLTAREAKKLLSDDIKKAAADGYLPANVSYSVSASGYNNLSVTVRGMADSVIFNSDAARDSDDHWSRSFTPDAKEVVARLDKMMSSYNYSDNDPMGDYHNQRFYGRPELETENYRKSRLEEAERKRLATYTREQAATVKALVSQLGPGVKDYGSVIARSVNVGVASSSGRRVVQWPDTKLFTVVEPDGTGKGVYNLSGVNAYPDGNLSADDVLAGNILRIAESGSRSEVRVLSKKRVI